MKPKFTLEELAMAMYDSTDHSDIQDDWSGYRYNITVNADGTFWNVDQSKYDTETFSVKFNFDEKFWDGIDRESFDQATELSRQGAFPYTGVCGVYSYNQYQELIYILLSRADYQEDLDNDNFREAAESMFTEICEWLSQKKKE